jgi:hypothetical protein
VTRQNLDSTIQLLRCNLCGLRLPQATDFNPLKPLARGKPLAEINNMAWDMDPGRPIASAICPSLHYPGTPLIISTPSPKKVYHILSYLSRGGISHVKIRPK